DVFAESLRRRAGAPEWVFYEGPPTANGRPGIHHVWARLFKDLYPRFHTMRGRHVARKAGWDCHGLPVEVEVEKELGITSKHQIEDFGIAEFNQRCRDSVHRYVEDWSSLTSRIGMWLDTTDAYWTLSNEFIESVWWQFRQMWDHGDIYEGAKVVPYCGRCGTALSSHELGQPGAYRDVTEPSVYVRFPVVEADFDLLVWTTTPWTLVSNVGAAVGPAVDYVRVSLGDGSRDLVLAAARVDDVLGDGVPGDVRVVGPVAAADLVGLRYRRPFELLPLDDVDASDVDTGRVVADDFVTLDDGSGIVHLAPAFGEIDRDVAEREGLGMLNPVGPAATFVDERVPYRRTFVKDADPAIIEDLTAAGLVVKVVDYTHSYPHCWRCGTPLIYWAKPTWFARTSAHRDQLLAENEQVTWHPEHIKHGRFGDWLENNVDWALSRDRFWGTPLPVWRCEQCGHDDCIGSVAELSERAGRDLGELDLHRPAVDDVVIHCTACGGRALRVEPVLDAWFDSGSMPAAQFHAPFEHAEDLERRFPADFICEAIDQTRGWFYSLLAVNTLVFGRAPYRNVLCLGLLVDQDGQKMSKSRGNVIDPWTILDSRGADALRWNFASTSSPWTVKRVSETGIDESTRRVLVTLWETYRFFVTYANLDGWEPSSNDAPPPAPTAVLDRWIRSRLHSTVRTVTDALEEFDALHAAQALESCVDDLSNWYVRRSRSRFWNSDDPAAHATLHEALSTLALLLAPFTPFLADELHRALAATDESVHLADWPAVDDAAIDPELEAEIARAREVVSLGLSARTESKMKVRQPLRRAIVMVPGGARFTAEVVREIADALNVKSVEHVTDLEGLLDHAVLPNFRTLGPKVGKRMPLVKDALAAADPASVLRALDDTGTFPLVLAGGDVIPLEPADVEVRARAHEELALAQGDGYAVALDTALDDALRAEGTAREVIRIVNDTRKQVGLEIADRIRLRLFAGGRVEAAAHAHRDW
ncbi:MAG TPA: isoleucine--tRNA ligase, partial [Acidimicrobiia bacterium]|nr:isoleucine--tRNA ligase [Acidimicrobiia bacterium]